MQGKLQIKVVTIIGNRPVSNARVRIYVSGIPDNVLYTLTTNSSGLTDEVELETPDIAYSLSPSESQPYGAVPAEIVIR